MNDNLYSVSDVELKFNTGEKKLDYEAFDRIQRNIAENIKKVGEEESLERRRENTKEWLSTVPRRWSSANLKNISEGPQLRQLLRSRGPSSFYLDLDIEEGLKSGYAILRVFVSQGWVSPYQIGITTEEEFLAAANGGFEGASFLKDFLKNRAFMVTISGRSVLNDREINAWSRLISHCFDEGLPLILVSTGLLEDFLVPFPDSTVEKLRSLVFGGTIEQEHDEEDEFDVFG